MEQYMDTYLSFCRLEAYAPILVLVVVAINLLMYMLLAHSAHVRNNQMQQMRDIEKRMRKERSALHREREALRKEREASRKERETWNTDYRIMCERMRNVRQ